MSLDRGEWILAVIATHRWVLVERTQTSTTSAMIFLLLLEQSFRWRSTLSQPVCHRHGLITWAHGCTFGTLLFCVSHAGSIISRWWFLSANRVVLVVGRARRSRVRD